MPRSGSLIDCNFTENSAMPKLEEGDYYYSDEGFIVFTKQYHLKRGYCCTSGCKHCPYGFDKATGTFKRKR